METVIENHGAFNSSRMPHFLISRRHDKVECSPILSSRIVRQFFFCISQCQISQCQNFVFAELFNFSSSLHFALFFLKIFFASNRNHVSLANFDFLRFYGVILWICFGSFDPLLFSLYVFWSNFFLDTLFQISKKRNHSHDSLSDQRSKCLPAEKTVRRVKLQTE